MAGEKKDVILTDSQQFNAEQLGLSVALGTYELSPYQAVQVWRLLSPHSISVITNEDETRWRNSLRSLRQEIIDALSDSSYRIH